MTQYLEKLEQGQFMLMEGPKGRLAYQGFGKILISGKEVTKKNIGLVSGGTGITPCYQVLQAALNGDDGTNLSLVFANRSVDDILLKAELDQFQQNYPERFKLFYSVDTQPQGEWKGGVGWLNEDMLKNNLPVPGQDTMILFCGPPGFEAMVKEKLTGLGYNDSMLFKF